MITTTTDVDSGVTMAHPSWCEQSTACLDADEYPEHISHESSFVAIHNGTRVTLSVRRNDEIHSQGYRGEPHVWLGLEDLESTTPSGERIFADAYLNHEDVHMLRTFLARYDDMLSSPQFEVPTQTQRTNTTDTEATR